MAACAAALFPLSDDARRGAVHQVQSWQQCHLLPSFRLLARRRYRQSPRIDRRFLHHHHELRACGVPDHVLRKRFELVQLFQLVVGFVFGWLIDLNMNLLQPIVCDSLLSKSMTQLLGCTVMGIGISFEVKCGSVTMPGEGISIAVSRVTGKPFPAVKIVIDTLLVVFAIAASYAFFGQWKWNVIGPGTLFSMIYVGYVVKLITPRIGWFDRLMAAKISWKYVVGLARFIKR